MLLEEAGFGVFERIIITCVDCEYPVRCMGDAFAHFDVCYSAAHEQLAPAASACLYLRTRAGGRFEPIHAGEVSRSLGEGVVQLAEVNGTLIMGIPGDVYAFYPEGTGFGFGKPYAVRPETARHLLHAVAAYGRTREIVAMIHPDCILVASNEGKYQICAGEFNGLFPVSAYGAWEAELKQAAAESLREYVQDTLNIVFRTVSPAYVLRRPGILDAIRER